MEIHSIPVTQSSRGQVLALELLPEQRDYIETIEQCLEEAGRIRNWHPVGLYDGEELVGFAMYGWVFWEDFPRGAAVAGSFSDRPPLPGQGLRQSRPGAHAGPPGPGVPEETHIFERDPGQ